MNVVARAIRPEARDPRAIVAAVAEVVGPTRDDRDAIGRAIELLRQVRFGAFRLSIEEGGAGGGLTELFEVIIALAELDSNIPHILRNHFSIVEQILRAPVGSKVGQWRRLVRDGKIFGTSITELGAANNGDRAFSAELRRNGSVYSLNGRKFYSTGNLFADHIVVSANLEGGAAVTALVATDQLGVQILDDWDSIGQRHTASGTTVFTDVAVAPENIIFADEVTTPLPHASTFAQLYITGIIAGISAAVVRDAVALLKSRQRTFYHATAGRPTDDPLLQQIVGRLSTTAFAAEAAVLRAAETLERAQFTAMKGAPDDVLFKEAALRAAKAKIVVDQLAQDAASQLFDVGGASACLASKRLDRHWRNIRTIASHNPAAYKARAIGELLVNGTPLPGKSFF